MTVKEASKNIIEWIRLIYKVEPMIEEMSDNFFSLHYPEFTIMVDKSRVGLGYSVLGMSWHYDFREADQVVDFIESWKLI